MKIIENTKEIKPITFEDINNGDVFKIRNDKNYYMKTNERKYDICDDYGCFMYCNSINAVCLSSASLWQFNRTTEVIPVDCELIIK